MYTKHLCNESWYYFLPIHQTSQQRATTGSQEGETRRGDGGGGGSTRGRRVFVSDGQPRHQAEQFQPLVGAPRGVQVTENIEGK